FDGIVVKGSWRVKPNRARIKFRSDAHNYYLEPGCKSFVEPKKQRRLKTSYRANKLPRCVFRNSHNDYCCCRTDFVHSARWRHAAGRPSAPTPFGGAAER